LTLFSKIKDFLKSKSTKVLFLLEKKVCVRSRKNNKNKVIILFYFDAKAKQGHFLGAN
jgi:hypothetical protein